MSEKFEQHPLAVSVQQDYVIANLQRASLALSEARTIQQTKSLVDVAAAAEIYAKRQQLGEENIAIAHSIKLEALRKLGEMLKASPKNQGAKGLPGGGTRGTKKEPRVDAVATLAELGLDKKTSSIAQKLAELPQNAFEQVREGHETISKAIAAVKSERDSSVSAKTETPESKPNEEQHGRCTKMEPRGNKEAAQDDPEERQAEIAALHDLVSELRQSIKDLIEENNSLARVFEANDQVAAALSEAKRFREMNRILEERVRGQQNELNAAKRQAKSAMARADKIEREAKKAEQECKAF